jgi:formamidopyrimidine-DNA glycosylase
MPEILEVEAARKVLEARALDREITKVHAPDTWFMKRETTASALRHALVGNAFTTARRRGKQIVLDTRDPDVRIGVHLGMSGRVLVDDEEAGDPLVYASNRRVPKWHRFGVHFADGGDFMLRDPRRLGAVELDPDESRLGPDALTLSFKDLDHALGQRNAPVKAVLMDQHRIAGLGNLLVDESLWRAGIDPQRPPSAIGPDERKPLHKAIRTTLRTLDRRGGSHTGDMPRALDLVCPRDGSPLRRATVGGRTTYWCPAHQH